MIVTIYPHQPSLIAAYGRSFTLIKHHLTVAYAFQLGPRNSWDSALGAERPGHWRCVEASGHCGTRDVVMVFMTGFIGG